MTYLHFLTSILNYMLLVQRVPPSSWVMLLRVPEKAPSTCKYALALRAMHKMSLDFHNS